MAKVETKQVLSREKVVNIYNTIATLKIAALDKEQLVKHTISRVKLKTVFNEFLEVQKEAQEVSKPKDWKEGDSTRDWDEKRVAIINSWLKEDTDIQVKELGILSDDDVNKIAKDNKDCEGTAFDVLVEYFYKP